MSALYNICTLSYALTPLVLTLEHGLGISLLVASLMINACLYIFYYVWLLSTKFALMSKKYFIWPWLTCGRQFVNAFKHFQGKFWNGIWGLKLFWVEIFLCVLLWKSPEKFVRWKCWWRWWCLSEKMPGQLHITLGCIVVYFSILLILIIYPQKVSTYYHPKFIITNN